MSDPLFWLLLILRYMHILGAIALMGGTIFMRFALRPIVVGLPPETKVIIHEQVRSRWSKFVMLASLLLLISGITNLALAGRYNFEPVLGMTKGYHMVVGIKLLLALPIFFIAATLTGRSSLAKRFQANAELWMNVNLTLALVMVLIGGVLKFVQREPKGPMPSQAAVMMPLEQNASKKLPFREPGE
ncbi:MAG TPA: hypothetical protein VKH44_01855 [Pirellulaceae bacterium]|nr:hypothetical protein [Pirellulaceae bacterium]